MRMTAATLYRDASASLERTAERLVDFQRQVASGKRISRPSDDPQGTAASIVERAGVAAVEEYTRTADSATSRLTVMDTALSDLLDRLTQAQVTIVGVLGAPKAAAQRDVAAQVLEGVRDAVLADLNTSFRGTHLFAGVESTTPPFAKDGGGVVLPYQGSTTEVAVDIDETRSVTVGVDGSSISKGAAANDVFAVLDAAAAAARAGDGDGLKQALVDLGAAFERATEAQTRVGTGLASIDAQAVQLADRKLAGGFRVAKIEDANLAEAITGMNQAQAAYQAALGSTARITQLSLLDYLS